MAMRLRKCSRFSRLLLIMLPGLLATSLLFPTAGMSASSAQPTPYQGVYDLDWQLRYYLKENTLYNLDWQIEYYLRDDLIFDKGWMKRYYLKENTLYDLDWHRRYYVREIKDPTQ
jgi:hypothetical protein